MTGLRLRLAFACVLTIAIGGATAARGQRLVPENYLTYPVLLTLEDGSTGSGFFLHSGPAFYLVTAKHVLFDAKGKVASDSVDLLSYSKTLEEARRVSMTVNLAELQAGGNLKPHPSEDVVVLRLFTTKPGDPKRDLDWLLEPVKGVDVKQAPPGGIQAINAQVALKTFEHVLVGNDVYLFGYPTSLGLEKLPPIDVHRPLLRRGVIAGTSPEKRSIILDCPAYFGNSGGAVLELDWVGVEAQLHLIGVVVQYVPFIQTAGSKTFELQLASNSGYSIAVPIDFVMELIPEAAPPAK